MHVHVCAYSTNSRSSLSKQTKTWDRVLNTSYAVCQQLNVSTEFLTESQGRSVLNKHFST